MKNFRSFLHLPRNVYVLFLARIINSIGSFVYPLMTILLTQKLGYSADRAGTITTVAIAAGGIGMLIGGKIADHVGRKKLFIITSVLGALTFIACAFLGQSKSIVYLIIAGNFISIAQWPTVDAMVTDSTNKENRQNAFSLLYLGTNIGIAVGPLIAGFLINEHLMWFFLLDGITTLLSLILVIIFIKDTKQTKEQIDAIPETDNERAEKGSVFRAFLKRPLLIAFTSIIVLFTIVYAQYTFGLPLFANSIYGIDGPKIYGLLMSVNAVMVVVLTIFVISFTKKLPPLVSITIGGFLYACGFGMLYFTGNIYLLIVSTIIWTLGEIINTVNIEVFIANNAPVTHRGRFFALITFVQESGFAMSPMLSGFYIASFGIKNIWPLVALFAFVAAASMFGLFMWQKSLRKI